MARTHGHGNPDWTRDETILALALYFDFEGKPASPEDKRVIELSELLRRLPYHTEQAKKPTFRNAAGVAFKLQNLRSFVTGRGLQNVSATDRQIWAEFGKQPAKVQELGRLIRQGVEITTSPADAGKTSDDEGDEFPEGRTLTALHKRKERNRSIRKELLQKRRKSGSLKCDMCDSGANSKDADFDDAMFEAHHLLPLSEAIERKTRLSDMALLSANCHRVLHRAISRLKRWLTIEEGRELLKT